ncbi:hypothetical protein D3C85_508040 [compost metagenome]
MGQGVARRIRTRHRQEDEGARRIGRRRAGGQVTDVLAVGCHARQGDAHARNAGLARIANARVVVVDIDIAAEALPAGAEVIVRRRRTRDDSDGGHGRVARARRRGIGPTLAAGVAARAADEGARMGQTGRRRDLQRIDAGTQHLTGRRGRSRVREAVEAGRRRGDQAVDGLVQVVQARQANTGARKARGLARAADRIGVRVQEDHAAEQRGRQFAEVALGQIGARRHRADVEAFRRRSTAGVGDHEGAVGVLAVGGAVRLDQLRHGIGVRAVRRRDRGELIEARRIDVGRQVHGAAGVVRARQTDVRRRGEGGGRKARLAAAAFTHAVVVQVAIDVARHLGRADFLEDIACRLRGRRQDDVGDRIARRAAAIGGVVDVAARRAGGLVAVERARGLGLDDLIGPRRQAVEGEGAARGRRRRAVGDGVAEHIRPAQGQGDAGHALVGVNRVVAVVVAIDRALDRGRRDLGGFGLGVVGRVRVAADFLTGAVTPRGDAGRIGQVGVQRAGEGMRRPGEQGQGHGIARARREVAVQNAEDAAGPRTGHRRNQGRAAHAEGLAGRHPRPARRQGVGHAHLGGGRDAVVSHHDAVLDRLIDLHRRRRDAGLAHDLQVGGGNHGRGLDRRIVGQFAVGLIDRRIVLLQRDDLGPVGEGHGAGRRRAGRRHEQAEDHLMTLVQIVQSRIGTMQTAFDPAARHGHAGRRRRRIERQAAVSPDRIHLDPIQSHGVAGRRRGDVGNHDIAGARRTKVRRPQIIDEA